jgi:hypothetical protein
VAAVLAELRAGIPDAQVALLAGAPEAVGV